MKTAPSYFKTAYAHILLRVRNDRRNERLLG